MDKAYNVMKNIPYDVIKKVGNVTKEVVYYFEHFKLFFCAVKQILTVLVTYFPILNDVIRNLFYDNIGFVDSCSPWPY